MASVFDVAALIGREVPVTRMKLHKLLYYAQAWSLAWDGEALFGERIEAWERGPVVRELWGHQQHGIARSGDIAALSQAQRETVYAVIEFYGRFGGDLLSEFTHCEAPWRSARQGTPPGARSQAEITHEQMRRYYSQIPTHGKRIPHEHAQELQALTKMPPELLDELLSDGCDETPLPAGDHLDWLEGACA